MDGNRFMSEGFYKYEEPFLLNGKWVLDAEYELHAKEKDEYNYPVYGWYWFDSREEALEFFNVTDEEVI